MGGSVSTPDCFVLAQLPPEKFAELLAEDFTVIRTSGDHQAGWRIPSVTHLCHQGKWAKHHAQAWDHITDGEGEKSWCFHMVYDRPDVHVCGWRRERSFWPTRLTTEEEKEAWWTELDALVATLKRTRDMTDAEWFPLLEAQKAREDAEEAKWETSMEIAAVQAQRDKVIAPDPEMASRHTFWKTFETELAKRKEELKQLRTQVSEEVDLDKKGDLQGRLTALEMWWGADDLEMADKLQKVMLQKKAEEERNAVVAERNAQWKELDDQEQAAVKRKDYAAAQRALCQKETAKEVWAEEDAKVAKVLL
jgi:hypothetical protein